MFLILGVSSIPRYFHFASYRFGHTNNGQFLWQNYFAFVPLKFIVQLFRSLSTKAFGDKHLFSYLDLLLLIRRDGQLHTFLYDKRDDFKFHITNYPFLISNLPSSQAYSVFFSQLIRYGRAYSSYECFILRAVRLSCKLLVQWYVRGHFNWSIRKFYGQYGDFIKHYEVPFSQILHCIQWHDHTLCHPQSCYRTGAFYHFWRF